MVRILSTDQLAYEQQEAHRLLDYRARRAPTRVMDTRASEPDGLHKQMRKISLVVLTYNRAAIVQKAMYHNLANAGRPIDELVWIDNGSTDGTRLVMQAFEPAVTVLHKENLGVAKGYNRGYALASGEYVVLTGCDMLMPENWLLTFERYLDAIPNTGVACMFSQPIEKVRERIKGAACNVNGLPIQPALPIGRRIVRRELLVNQIGYLREDFGLYGWEDVEWAERAHKVCRELGLLTYSIPNQVPEHLWLDFDLSDISKPVVGPDAGYQQFKVREVADPSKQTLMEECRRRGYSYYNPFAGKR